MTPAQFIKSFRSTWGSLTAAATAGPVALLAAGLCPPWPGENGASAAALATLAAMSGIAIAFLTHTQPQARRRSAVLALVGALVLAVALLAVWSQTYLELPHETPSGVKHLRFVVGFTPHPFAAGLAAGDIYRLYGLDGWTAGSLLAARLASVSLMMGVFLAATYGFGVLQLAHVADRAPQLPGPDAA